MQLYNNIFKENKIDNEEYINLIINLTNNIFASMQSNFQKLIENIILKLIKYLSILNEEQIKYKSFNEIYKIIQQKKKSLLEKKNNYLQSGKELEEYAINFFSKNEIPSKEMNNLMIKAKENLNKYKIEINEIEK